MEERHEFVPLVDLCIGPFFQGFCFALQLFYPSTTITRHYHHNCKRGALAGPAFGALHTKWHLPQYERTILNVGKPGEKLHAITTAADVKGNVYVDVGFYALHPPVGIRIAQAGDVLHRVWELLMEYYPPKEITESTVLLRDKDLALFRMSFRVLGSNGQPQL